MRQFLRVLPVLSLTFLLSGASSAPSDVRTAQFTGSLRDGNYRVHAVTLRTGYNYEFTGACDRDCDDLDLQLYDEDENLIDEDLLPDDVPIVSVSPRWTGEFYVKVTMASCSISPCRYAVVF